MMEKFQKINTLKSEHLKEGVQPIIACVGTYEDYPGLTEKLDNYTEEDGTLFVDFFAKPEELDKRGILNAGSETYAISPVDERNKISTRYKNCTGVIATGRDNKTNENVSFVSHQKPEEFLPEEKEEHRRFIKDLEKRLSELKKRCAEGTVDAVIFGGNYPTDEKIEELKHKLKENVSEMEKEWTGEYFRNNYTQSLELLNQEIAKILGFEPVIITGPKGGQGGDCIFYKNKDRRLHIVTPEIGSAKTESYLPNEIKKQAEKWEKESTEK